MTGKLAVVFGGSGFIGRNVVRELARRGWRVRVGVRRPHQSQFLRPMGAVGQIQLSQVNIRHRPSIAEALKGADAVVNLVGVLFQDGANGFAAVQSAGAASIAQLSAEAGIKNLVHLSAIGADAEGGSIYARTKGEGEKAVLDAFPSATILRPSIVFGPEDGFFNRFATMATSTPLTPLPLIGGGKTRFQPVYVDDVADAVCAALEQSDAKGRIFELGGPGIYTFRELMEIMLREIGRKRLLAPLPAPVASLIGFFGQLAGKLPFVEPVLTQDQAKLAMIDNVVNTDGSVGTLADLGIEPQALEAILPTYMEPFRKYGQFAERAA